MARPRIHPLPSIEFLRERFDYNPETGDLIFRSRPPINGVNVKFNNAWAGKVAGCRMNVGYRFVRVGSQAMLAHRVAWAIHHGAWPVAEIDHKDGDKLNNRIDNLREATRSQNNINRPGRALSGYKGVARRGKRWKAVIQVNRHEVHLGTFDTPELAHAAYKGAIKIVHGDFANGEVYRIGKIAATIVFEVAA